MKQSMHCIWHSAVAERTMLKYFTKFQSSDLNNKGQERQYRATFAE